MMRFVPTSLLCPRHPLLAALSVAALCTAAVPSLAAPYQLYMETYSCTGLGGRLCQFDFAPVPGGSQVQVTHVSCAIHGNTGSGVYSLGAQVIASPSTAVATTVLAPTLINSDAGSGERIWVANQPVLMYASPGQFVRAFGLLDVGSTAGFMSCNISGVRIK